MADKQDILWFVAGITTGVMGTLIIGVPYLADLVQKAEDNAKKTAVATAPAKVTPWPPSFLRMVSSNAVTLARDEMLLIRTSRGVAVLRFDTSEPSSAEFHWRCLPPSLHAMEGAGSVKRGSGEDLLKTLTLGTVTIDWLGRGTEGTILYHDPKSTTVERRPGAQFGTIDLAAELAAAKP